MTHRETKEPLDPCARTTPFGGAEFVVHHDRDGAVAVVEGTKTVGDADQPVAVVRTVADGDQRFGGDARCGRDKERRLRGARTGDGTSAPCLGNIGRDEQR